MKEQTRNRKVGLLAFVLVIIAIFTYMVVTNSNNHNFNQEKDDNTTQVPVEEIKEEVEVVTFSPDELYSSNAILFNLGKGTVLMAKNIKDKIYPASLTKIMTAIVAIENLPDLNEEFILTNSVFSGLYEAGAAMAGFVPGEKVRAIDLLYGTLLRSGAESCVGIAHLVAGSEEEYTKLMNEKARELKMLNTHFNNTTGLHDDNHYTTIEDLTILIKYALKNVTFREMFTSSKYLIPPTNKYPNGRTISNTMFNHLDSQNLDNGEIIGGKTGFTDEAGLCLASLAKIDDREYVLITVGAKGNTRTEQYNVTDALNVYSSIEIKLE